MVKQNIKDAFHSIYRVFLLLAGLAQRDKYSLESDFTSTSSILSWSHLGQMYLPESAC